MDESPHPADLYATKPPWDIGRPQPALRAIAEDGLMRGRVLDVGCGTGEHALMAARLGLDVTGVDVAATALEVARDKARDAGLTVRFLQHDAQQLAGLGESFDTVLDCGLFHIFAPADRPAFVDSLRTAMRPGGRYFMLGFSDLQPGVWGPHRLTQQEIREAFADGWRVEDIAPATIEITTQTEGIQAWLSTITKLLTAEGTVETDRPERYLTQLGRHASAMSHGPHAATQVQVESTPTRTVLRFVHWGQCVVEASGSALSVRIEAADEEALRRMQDIIAADIARFGRRDQLTVSWR